VANNFLFDLLAPFYDRVIRPKEDDQLLALLKLPAKGWMLDAGGGTGRISAGLLSQVDHLVLCDLSFAMLSEAKQKGIANSVQASSKRPPFSAETFERVLVVDALHHFNDQKETISQLLQVLKKGGRMLIEEPDINLFPAKVVALLEKLALMKSYFHTPNEIKAIIDSHGYDAQVESDGSFAAWVITDK
jgi:demethylmenaquinone methyltransferase/2-methoxy-6-polyprenyl-1,4-benzoquinol methylase